MATAISTTLHFPHPPRLHLLLLTSGPHSSCSSSQTRFWLRSWSHHLTALPRRPSSAVDCRSHLTSSSSDDDFSSSRSTGSSTMGRIIEKLQHFGYKIDDNSNHPSSLLPTKGTVEDIFDTENGGLSNRRVGFDDDNDSDDIGLFPWETPRMRSKNHKREKRERAMVAELTLPEGELRRLRHLALRIKSKTKVSGAGVTNEVVQKIREKWRTEEVVRVKVEGPPALNMRRVHEILEVRLWFCY